MIVQEKDDARFVLIKKGQKGVRGKQRLLSSEFALEKQGKSEANYLIAGLLIRLFFIAFGFCLI